MIEKLVRRGYALLAVLGLVELDIRLGGGEVLETQGRHEPQVPRFWRSPRPPPLCTRPAVEIGGALLQASGSRHFAKPPEAVQSRSAFNRGSSTWLGHPRDLQAILSTAISSAQLKA